ncbi:sporulation protein YunB [Paenibacillus sp. 1001270B_150601_E10]|uniref:sporulation protein YunB n=1 Tax=Paenibacillus sp. 1001270B_150601_E10 TaxID=2787079 RepID=UPI0018A072EE|nr:sporulation protein YunB [Paenibacillus sp. 1001270B_150601_E10]
MRWGSRYSLKRLLQDINGPKRTRKWGRPALNWPSVNRSIVPKRTRWHSSSTTSNRGMKSVPYGKASQDKAAKPNSMAGWKSPPSKPKRRRRAWFIAFIIFVLLSVQMFIYVDQNLKGPLMHLAKIRVKQVATQAINHAISSQVMQGRELDKLIEWKTDNQGKVTSFILNYNEHMRITSETTAIVQQTLLDTEQFDDHIPLGQALGSAIIASFGPRIPVKMEPQGAVKVELNTRPREVGINMVLVEVFVKVVEEVAIVIPFDMEPEVIETEIPISYLLVVGDVPMYYYDGSGKPVGDNRDQAPSLALPPLPTDQTASQGGQAGAGSSGISSGEGNGVSTNNTGSSTHSLPTGTDGSLNLKGETITVPPLEPSGAAE